MGAVLTGVGALGANCEPAPPGCDRVRPADCGANNQVTACINHCLTPVDDGNLCAFDSCDLFLGAGLPNVGVCKVESACAPFGGPDPRVGRCTPRDPSNYGCSNPVGSGSATHPAAECPYGGYCTPRGDPASVPGSCGPTDTLQNGLPGLCRRYARVGEECDGVGADARRTTPLVGVCRICEPGARCIAVNRLHPDDGFVEAFGAQTTEFRCVRTCASGSDGECDCPGATADNVVNASVCFSAWSGSTPPPRETSEGPICVRPGWCAPDNGYCGPSQAPECTGTPPPVANDVRCLPRPCCARGAACVNNTCKPCVKDGQTLTSESRCCIDAYFVTTAGGESTGRCHPCVGENGNATEQRQCCPGLHLFDEPGGNWITPSSPYNNWLALNSSPDGPRRGHRVCDPATGSVACVMIPGADYCDQNSNCFVTVGGGAQPNLQHQNEMGVTSIDPPEGPLATWYGAQLLRRGPDDTFVPLRWNETASGVHGMCVSVCRGAPCGGECAAALTCENGVTCDVRMCPTGQHAVTCWNHREVSNLAVGGCR